MEGQPLVIYPASLQTDVPVSFRDQPALDQSSSNIYYFRGALTTREGWRQLAVTVDGKNITGMFTFQGQDGTFNLITASTDHVYKSSAPSYATLTDITGGTALTMLDTGATVLTALLDLSKSGFIATNNKDPPYLWKLGDATRTILAAAPAIARTVCTSMVGIGNSRVVFGNTTESGTRFPSRVRWSALGDPTTYPATAIADLLSTPDSIVAVRAFTRQTFAIYKDKSQWLGIAQQGSDAAAFRFELIDRQPGPIGPNAVYDGPHNSHVYLANDGNLYQFDGSSSRVISRTSDVQGVFFDSARSENNTILYDTRRNVIDAWLWPVVNTGVANLVTISTGCTGTGGSPTITFRSASNVVGSDTVTIPSGVAANDLLVAAVLALGNPVVTGPSGWVKDIQVFSTNTLSFWHKIASSSEPSTYQFINASNIALLRYDGNRTDGSVFDTGTSVSFTNSSTINIPIITTATAKEMFTIFCSQGGAPTHTWDSPIVERVFWSGDAVADELIVNAGPIDQKQVKLSSPQSGTLLVTSYKSGLSSSSDCIGLITIFINPGIFGLIAAGNLNIGLIHSFSTGQIYPQTVLPKRLRAIQLLADVGSTNRFAGLDSSICVDDAAFDSFVGSLPATLAINLPVLPRAEYEIDAIELYYDVYGTNEVVSISVLAGKTTASLKETVISSSGLGNTDRKISRGINIRGRFIRIKLTSSFIFSLKIRRIEITAWVRPLQTN